MEMEKKTTIRQEELPMKIKIKMGLWGLIGGLLIGSTGCGNTIVCYTTEVPADSTVETESTKKSEAAEMARETLAAAVETNEAIPEPDIAGSVMEKLVSDSILEENSGHYLQGECQGEGHIILDEVEVDGISTVYALMMYGEYEFQNVDYFVKTAGTGVIPVVLQYDIRLNSHTPLVSFEWPADGSGYNESIKQMFPEYLWDRVLSIQEEDRTKLEKMEREYARQYLEEMGRDAVVCDYRDFEHTLLTDLGVSVEVSNKMLVHEKLMGPYPDWVGSTEKVEDGVRYMYSLFYEEETNEIIYEKRVFETDETVEKFIYDAETGEPV